MQIKKIICAIDNDPLAESVFDIGFDLAQKIGAELALISIIDPANLQTGESGISVETMRISKKEEINQLFARLLQRRKSPNIFKFSEEGSPKKLIVEIANSWGADLIVIASHARTGFNRVLMGSVAESVLRHATCPVLIVPAQK